MKKEADVLTISEAAKALRVTTRTIRNYLKAGSLPSTKPYGKRLIPADVVHQKTRAP